MGAGNQQLFCDNASALKSARELALNSALYPSFIPDSREEETARKLENLKLRDMRMTRAMEAHDDLVAAAYRAQADALEIGSAAKRQLAEEYDAAQERKGICLTAEKSSKGNTFAKVV